MRARAVGAAARVPTGRVVAAVGGGLADVDLGGVTRRLAHLRGYTPAVGDVVLVDQVGGVSWVLGALGATAPPPPPGESDPDTTPTSSPTSGTELVAPVQVDTWRGGKWREAPYLWQGDWGGYGRNYGAAFYGRGPSSLPGPVTGGRVTLIRVSGGVYAGQVPTMRLLTQRTRPAGAPTAAATAAGPSIAVGEQATWELPASWASQLGDGTAGGLGIGVDADTPYLRLSGTIAGAMTVHLDWAS